MRPTFDMDALRTMVVGTELGSFARGFTTRPFAVGGKHAVEKTRGASRPPAVSTERPRTCSDRGRRCLAQLRAPDRRLER